MPPAPRFRLFIAFGNLSGARDFSFVARSKHWLHSREF
jgi:hypothetical protein